MTWKEFLKPSVLKIIIAAVIFFVIFYIFVFIPSTEIRLYALIPASFRAVMLDMKQMCCNELLQNKPLEVFCGDYANQTGFVFTVANCNAYISQQQQAARNYYFYSTIMFYAMIVVAVLISYLVSCFIVWLVSGRKKNAVQDEKMSGK